MTEIPKDFPWRAGMLHNVWGRLLVVEFCDDGAWVCGHEQPINEWGNTANPPDVATRSMHYVFEKGDDDVPAKIVEVVESDGVPDLTDPATVGALAAAVREAWNDPALYAVPVMDEERDGPIAWSIRQPARYGSHERGRGVTRGEAWLAAWNARPVPK